ncbi:hypothetical protein Tco_0956153 [Tanacetum coccineum]|uniref:Reverse transcriptase domain-containing protein n=1 Tax=Tanacetum coccineum TaxID=301880 RepID=A0ABQ5E9E4_9ASTR
MEKTYTWIEAREVATNKAPNDRRDKFERSRKSSWDNERGQKSRDRFSPYRGPNHGLLSSLSKSPREILAIEKVARSFEQPHRMLGSRRSRDMSKYCYFHEDYGHDTNDCRQLRSQIEEAMKSGQLSYLVKGIKKERAKTSNSQQGEKKEKITTSAEAPILMTNQEEACTRNNISKSPTFEGREITFPLVTKGSNSSAPVVIKAKIFGREVMIGDAPLSRSETLNFVIVRKSERHPQQHTEGVLSCTDAEEKITVNNKYPEHTVTIIKQLPGHFKESHIKPIKQKRRSLGPHRSIAARKEVKELTRAGILREVAHQTWVANPVMVKKSNRGWRMCVDFTDINKACTKDCYLLLEIDWKVESLSGFYLNTSEEDMLTDIKETFQRFRSINMKLNPKKCSFDIEEGPFLGHLITKQGIRANPSKVKAIADTEQPKTLKDIQSLNGKLAALSRFLSKGAERKHKRSFIREKGRRTGSYLLCKQSPTRSRAQLPRTGKTHTSVGTRSEKVAKIFSGTYGSDPNQLSYQTGTHKT